MSKLGEVEFRSSVAVCKGRLADYMNYTELSSQAKLTNFHARGRARDCLSRRPSSAWPFSSVYSCRGSTFPYIVQRETSPHSFNDLVGAQLKRTRHSVFFLLLLAYGSSEVQINK